MMCVPPDAPELLVRGLHGVCFPNAPKLLIPRILPPVNGTANLVDAAGNLAELLGNRGKHCRVGDPHFALVAGKEITEDHAKMAGS